MHAMMTAIILYCNTLYRLSILYDIVRCSPNDLQKQRSAQNLIWIRNSIDRLLNKSNAMKEKTAKTLLSHRNSRTGAFFVAWEKRDFTTPRRSEEKTKPGLRKNKTLSRRGMLKGMFQRSELPKRSRANKSDKQRGYNSTPDTFLWRSVCI